MTVIVDDQILFEVLAGRVDGMLQAELDSGGAFTTGSWCDRLARVVSAGTDTGTLSGRFGALDLADQVRVRTAFEDLPVEIGLISMRYLVPVMQALRVRRPLNLLNAEALGAAAMLDADLVVSVQSPSLAEAASDLAVPFRVMD